MIYAFCLLFVAIILITDRTYRSTKIDSCPLSMKKKEKKNFSFDETDKNILMQFSNLQVLYKRYRKNVVDNYNSQK